MPRAMQMYLPCRVNRCQCSVHTQGEVRWGHAGSGVKVWRCCAWSCTVRDGRVGQGEGQVTDSAASQTQVLFLAPPHG